MSKINIESLIKNVAGSLIILLILSIFMQGVNAASPNDACFAGGCHNSTSSRPIDHALYDSNPHKIIKCISCHTNSIDNNDSDHGHFIRQLNGSTVPGPGSTIGVPLKIPYSSQSFSLCYSCHNETKLIGVLPEWTNTNNPDYHTAEPIYISSIGTNFINTLFEGYRFNGYWPSNIHWDHLEGYGVIKQGMYDYNKSGTQKSSYQTCPTCHNVHGTNYPKMTKNDMAITYGNDIILGSFGYMASENYSLPGGDLWCGACHTSGPGFKYYRNEIKLYDDCVSCHIYNVDNIENISRVNQTAFSHGVHVNISTIGGSGVINNNDCWTCHFEKDMDRINISKCEDCHTGSGKPEAPAAPKITSHLTAKTNYSCVYCHSKVIEEPGTAIVNVTSHYLKRPIITTPNYCDYCHGPNPGSPFNATNKTIPAFNHDDPSWNGDATCRTCHSNSSVQADPLANDSSSFHDLTTELGDVNNGTTRADCFICHVQKSPQFVAAPSPSHDITDYNAEDCRNCHTNGAGTQPQKLHSITASATSGCISCHSNNETRFYADTSLFGRHANVNATGGQNNVTDDDCKTCHFGTADGTMKMKLGAANSSNTYFCDACHTAGGSGPIKSTILKSISHGSTDCKWCHIAGDPLPRPLINENETLRYHPNGPKGTAAGKNCLTCHVSANLPDLPFHAPGESHSGDLNDCSDYCHENSDPHRVTPFNAGNSPTISGLSVTTRVTSGTPAIVQATVTDDYMQIAAAQYRVTNASGEIIPWTNMTPSGGRFSSSNQGVYSNIATSGLIGTYTVNVKGMASAYKTNPSLPYYPMNGQWSTDPYSTQFIVEEPRGYNNGTVYGILGNSIAGAIVSTETGNSTITNNTGFYSLSLTNGTYNLTASKEPEYYANSSVISTVNAVATVTRDIILALKPTGTITGNVTIK